MVIAGMAANANIYIAVSNAISIADAIAIATYCVAVANSNVIIYASRYSIAINTASAIEAIAIDIEHKTIISTTSLEQGYIYHATYSWRTMRRKTHCPEIPKQEIEKMLNNPDHEIAKKLGTSTYCVRYWRSQYLLPKRRKRTAGRDKLNEIEKLLSRKCIVTSNDYNIKGYELEELFRRGYGKLIIDYLKGGSGRHFKFILPVTTPRYIVYRYRYKKECEDQLVDMLANMIFESIKIEIQRHIKRFVAVVKEFAEKNNFPKHIADKLASRVEDLLRRSLSQHARLKQLEENPENQQHRS
jgi:hypothetical protein